MKIDDVKSLLEMDFEIGARKDGSSGYRSVINGNMTDNTPPENKKFIDAVMLLLKQRNSIGKLSKFDLSSIDVQSNAAGGAKVNFDEGGSIMFKPFEVQQAMQQIGAKQ